MSCHQECGLTERKKGPIKSFSIYINKSFIFQTTLEIKMKKNKFENNVNKLFPHNNLVVVLKIPRN